MLRLHLPGRAVAGEPVTIPREQVRHLHALRLVAGDRLRVFDDDGREHEVVLDRVTSREASGRVVASFDAARESPLELALLPALVKHDKMDWVIEKATELGVTHIAPITTRFTVARGDHVERWRRIALAAAKQCGRTRIPVVDAPRPLADAVAAAWPGLRLMAWEDEDAVRPADLPAAASAVCVLVGPEGGFEAAEVATARAAGFRTVSLGRRVLRAETASIAAVTLCQHRWGDV